MSTSPQSYPNSGIAEALRLAQAQTGATLAALSDERPLLLVFLRQFG